MSATYVRIEKGRKAVYFATFIPYFHSQMVENNRLLARSTEKSTDSLRRQGVEVLRGTFEYLESL
jgi:hypothetical protein